MLKQLLILAVLVAIAVPVVSASFTLKYDFYGDSITAGYGISNPADFYGHQMVVNHDPSATWHHNIDGSGKTTKWGWENIDTHYNHSSQYFVVMLGNNDIRNNINGTEAGNYLVKIYNYIAANGSTPVILMHTLETQSWGDSRQNITAMQLVLTANGIPYVEMYDALDSSPNNDQLDGPDGTNMVDGVHPNYVGHTLMGNYLWAHLPPPLPTPLPQQTNDKSYTFGAPGWTPVIGNWDGTGKKIGVYKDGVWYLDWNGNGKWDAGIDKAYTYGAAGYTPLVGDWNNDGKDEIGVSNGTNWYFDYDGNGSWD